MSDLIGRKLGKYQLIERLGRGGMAEVYKAFQPGVERHVAVKVMHGHLSDNPEFVQRFQQEARSIGQLQHPHIGRVIDFDMEADVYYMVMDYVQGGALDSYLKQQGLLPVDEAVQITLQLAYALAYAHQQGTIHRDIKPGNVLFTDDAHSHALLTDFGIARLLGEQSNMTIDGALVGTPNYMSPEAAQGEPCDARSDIYSLGIVLYEMVTGRTPYAAETPYSFLLKQANEPLPPPRTLNPQVPVAVEAVLLKALEKDPKARYQSAAEFAAALQAVQASPIGSTPLDSKVPAKPWLRLALAGIGVLLVAALTVLGLMRMSDGTSTSDPVPTVTSQAAVVVATTSTPSVTPSPPPSPTTIPTQTPTGTPSVPPTPTAEPIILVPRTLGALHLTDAGGIPAAGFALALDQMRMPPADHHYELWLVGDDSSLRLGEPVVEQGRIRFAGEATQNLVIGFSRAEVRIVSNSGGEAGETVLVSQHPTVLATALQGLLENSPDSPGLLTGARTQLAIAALHGGFLADALAADDLDEGRRHAEHIVNILDGESGLHYGDLNGDGQAQNPGGNYGVRPYLLDVAASLAAASTAMSTTQTAQLYAENILAAQSNALAHSEQAIETALKLFAADTLAEAQPFAPALNELLDAAANGVDNDNNGIVDPARQEGALLAAYALTLALADYPFEGPDMVALPAMKGDGRSQPAGWLRLVDGPLPATPATTPTPATNGGDGDSNNGYNYGSGQLSQSADAPIPASRFVLELDLLPLPPVGRQYVGWLASPTGQTRVLGTLPLTDRPVLTGTTDENLLLNYTRILITSEPVGSLPEQMGEQVLLIGEHPTSFLTPIQTVLFRSEEHDGGLLTGAREQMAIVIAHSGFLQDAVDNDLAEARRHAEHIINVIEGKEGQHFGDLDRDGMAQNPGDGVGVRVYLLAAREQMALAAEAMPPTLASRYYADRYLAANDHSLLLLEDAYEKALQVFAADSSEEARPLANELRDRVHAALEGEDLDGNRTIDPFADEGGIGVLYEMGLLFSQFALFEE